MILLTTVCRMPRSQFCIDVLMQSISSLRVSVCNEPKQCDNGLYLPSCIMDVVTITLYFVASTPNTNLKARSYTVSLIHLTFNSLSILHIAVNPDSHLILLILNCTWPLQTYITKPNIGSMPNSSDAFDIR